MAAEIPSVLALGHLVVDEEISFSSVDLQRLLFELGLVFYVKIFLFISLTLNFVSRMIFRFGLEEYRFKEVG